jgi:hypothetical protein
MATPSFESQDELVVLSGPSKFDYLTEWSVQEYQSVLSSLSGNTMSQFEEIDPIPDLSDHFLRRLKHFVFRL